MNNMTNNKLNDQDDALGWALERSFRKAVIESLEHGYVSFTDHPANAEISVLPRFIMLDTFRDASGKVHVANGTPRAKKTTKKSA
jgi:hypothetical protein